LHEKVQEHDIDEVYVGGVALDVCVMSTCRCRSVRIQTHLIVDASRGLSEESNTAAIAKLKELGVKIINSEDIIGEVKHDEL
jgi:nicotinamidase/pyrazinamidase